MRTATELEGNLIKMWTENSLKREKVVHSITVDSTSPLCSISQALELFRNLIDASPLIMLVSDDSLLLDFVYASDLVNLTPSLIYESWPLKDQTFQMNSDEIDELIPFLQVMARLHLDVRIFQSATMTMLELSHDEIIEIHQFPPRPNASNS